MLFQCCTNRPLVSWAWDNFSHQGVDSKSSQNRLLSPVMTTNELVYTSVTYSAEQTYIVNAFATRWTTVQNVHTVNNIHDVIMFGRRSSLSKQDKSTCPKQASTKNLNQRSTAERPYLGVRVAFLCVFFQQIAVAKRLRTQSTLVLLVACVYDHVTTQVACAREPLATNLAPIPIQAPVEVLVQFQTAARHKCFAAFWTTPWLLWLGW